jgi:signal transduction histidine kinase
MRRLRWDRSIIVALFIVGLFIASILGILFYTVHTLNEHKQYTLRMDLAGRQRLLSVKHLNQTMLAAEGVDADYASTRKVFSNTLEALIHGGPALVTLGKDHIVTIPPAPTDPIRSALLEQQELMRAFTKKADAYLASSGDDPAHDLKELVTLNRQLQDNAIETVRLMETYSDSRIAAMIREELAVGLLVVLAAVLCTTYLMRTHRGLLNEMTERQRAEAALRESERFARSTVDALPLQIAILDDRGIILNVNKAWRDFALQNSGTLPSLMEGADYLTVCDVLTEKSGEQFAAFVSGLRAVILGERRHLSLEYPCQTIDGERWLMGHITRFLIEGRNRVVIAYEEITERKRAEEVLRQSQRERLEALRQSDSLKSALLSSVSHELRTPLTTIKASVSTLFDHDGRMTADMRAEFLNQINETMDYLARLVNNLLDMSRIEAGTLIPRLEWHPIEDLVEGAIRLAGAALQRRTIEVDLPEERPLVHVDGVQLQQVLVNLLDNAVKYSPDLTPIRIEVSVRQQVCEIQVSNAGPGIPTEELIRIFERFHRVRGQHERSIPGTGLGLAICKWIIEAHGGRIWAESAPGEQTTIAFALPRTKSFSSAVLEREYTLGGPEAFK